MARNPSVSNCRADTQSRVTGASSGESSSRANFSSGKHNDVEAKIRQTLQQLCDSEYIEFVSRGVYRRV
ncbi:hypothetical protein [Corynebacterium sp. NML130628]|uniref:hypothetical protein n=1 Tax=Corynebacterium sp. NML130628 TaxID=1906333 RepID=UPI003514D2FE